MADQVHVEVAWETDPLVRPAEIDWTRIGSVDPKLRVEKLSTSRGVNIRTGEIDTGEATATIRDPNGNLDPSNVLSEWAPNVLPRRRIRFVVDPDPDVVTVDTEPVYWDTYPVTWASAGPTVLWTGFLHRLPPAWRRELQWTKLTARGIFWLLADEALPPSVLHVETMALAPDAYWPFTESSGLLVEDVAGTADGQLSKACNGEDIVPYASGGKVLATARMRATVIPTGEDFTVSGWFRTEAAATLWEHAGPGGEYVRVRVTSAGVVLEVSDGSTSDSNTGAASGLLDGRTHTVTVATVLVSSVLLIVRVYVDGQVLSVDLGGGLINSGLTFTIDGEACVAGLRTMTIGDISAEVTTGHVAWWNSQVPTAAGVLWDAGTQAWAGDLTGARLNRILDVVGVDAGDRDIATGTQTCGPTALAGENVMEYVRAIAATEGGPVGEDAEGRIFMRERTANSPAIVATFSDDPVTDGGSAVAPLELDFSLDRVISTAVVTRENGVTQTSTAPGSAAKFGKTVSLSTLHQSPSGSRAAGARLTLRNGEPRLVFSDVVADSIDTDALVMLGTDIGQAVDVIARPPRGGDPIEQTSIVERVEHEMAGGESWKATFGVVAHTVLPEAKWDTAGRGWDQSVVPA